jgi:threonine dehydrogenase-like Zn-dependent dehydrogenase
MRAVVFKAPFEVRAPLLSCGVTERIRTDIFKVAVEDRPYPKLQHSTDAILKVTSTALCVSSKFRLLFPCDSHVLTHHDTQGSDLHFYRGHLKCPGDFVAGHEFVGTIIEKGDAVTEFEIGEQVVVPFYTACQECYYCVRGQASRCAKGELFGNSVPANTIDGGQAEYVRVPLAQTTLVRTPKGMLSHFCN